MADGPVEPMFTFLAEFLDPTRSACLEFRVIFALPGSGDIFKGPDLLQSPKLLFGGLSKEFTATPLPDQTIDLGDEGFRNDDVCASRAHLNPTSC
jgi:hypothetical protein